MKKIITILFTCVALLTACIDYDSATHGTSFNVQLVMADTSLKVSLAGRTVSIKSHEGRVIRLITDSTGRAHTDDLIPDLYTISTSWNENKGLIVSGTLPQQAITSSTELTLTLRASIISPLLISKIYMAGAKDRNNTYYLNGTYMEIYNQSDSTIDVAGLYIGLLESNSTIAYTLENLHEQHADSVVLLKQVFRIPTAKPYPVAPGGTVLLCNSAIDHSQYTDMEHSLLDADFEAKDLQMKVTNNPDVPALEAVYLQTTASLSNLNLTRGGPAGIVIFNTEEDVTAMPLTYKYPNTATTGAQWILLPKRLIIDGVDVLHRKNTGIDIQTKRLYTEIDAGYAVLSTLSGLDGEVIYRKTSEQQGANGQKRLVDTNNSTEDFQQSKTIKPREYD